MLRIVTLLLFCLGPALFAQESGSASEQTVPVAEPALVPVVELEEAGVLSTGVKEFELEQPNCLLGKFGKVYVYDSRLGKVLLFDGHGSFLGPALNEPLKKVRWELDGEHFTTHPGSLNIDTDITGRILLNAGKSFILIDGTPKAIENRYRLGDAVLWNGNIYALIRQQTSAVKDGFVQELNLFGRSLGVLGCNGSPVDTEYWGGFSFIYSYEDRLFLARRTPINMLEIVLKEKRCREIKVDLETMMERTGWRWPEKLIYGEMRQIRIEPAIGGVEVHDDEIFLLSQIPWVESLDFHIIAMNFNGEILRSFVGRIPKEWFIDGMALSKRGQEITFFVLMWHLKEDGPYEARVVMFNTPRADVTKAMDEVGR